MGMIIEIPDWARIGKDIEVKDVDLIRGDDRNVWYKERIISFGYDGVFHQAYNCPIYYTKFKQFNKTIRNVGDTEMKRPDPKFKHLDCVTLKGVGGLGRIKKYYFDEKENEYMYYISDCYSMHDDPRPVSESRLERVSDDC